MSEPIISVSGLRGIVGDSLTPELAVRYACAFVAGLPAGSIVITRDGRATGRMLADALRGGLAAVGRDVIDADVAATPTTGVLVRAHQAPGGIQISASHNPAEYNGLKLIGETGRVISAAAGQQVIARFRRGQPDWVGHERVGRVTICDDTTGDHVSLILKIVDLDRIRKKRFRVLLDANHGSGSLLGRRLLEELGCQVELLGATPDGQFAHPPEPTAENLATVLGRVTASGADIGFCQDPDADRLAVIDETGRYLGEEFTPALCVEHVLGQRKGPVVTNCSSSRMSQDIAARHGAAFYHAAVGEANVTDLMIEKAAVIGGEGNGGVIDPRVGYVRDSFVGMALLLDAMAARDCKISELAAELPQYAIVKTKMPLASERLPAAYEAIKSHFAGANVSTLDGLRLDWPGRWLLIRPSNTEPIVRLIAEAGSREAAEQLCDEATKVIAS